MPRKKAAKKTGAAAIKVISGEEPEHAAEQAAPPKAGKGKKVCPKCSEIVAARSAKCPKCQHVFVSKAKAKAKKAAKAPKGKPGRKPRTVIEAPVDTAARLADISRAVELVERLGGVDAAKKKLQTVKEVLG